MRKGHALPMANLPPARLDALVIYAAHHFLDRFIIFAAVGVRPPCLRSRCDRSEKQTKKMSP